MSSVPDATCDSQDHAPLPPAPEALDPVACERAVAIFRALGDAARLRILCLLMQAERCVTEIAEALGDSLPAVSQRLRLLRSERIVTYRREGKHVFYGLADQHIGQLVANALEHAREGDETASERPLRPSDG
jgi:ArsR family transcriptional regulator, lead/cadmium/zinc/bismuth-responsive transcriptional repressor